MLPLSDLGWCLGMHHLVSFISMAETFEVVYIKTIIVIYVGMIWLISTLWFVFVCVCISVCMLLYPVDVELQNVSK